MCRFTCKNIQSYFPKQVHLKVCLDFSTLYHREVDNVIWRELGFTRNFLMLWEFEKSTSTAVTSYSNCIAWESFIRSFSLEWKGIPYPQHTQTCFSGLFAQLSGCCNCSSLDKHFYSLFPYHILIKICAQISNSSAAAFVQDSSLSHLDYNNNHLIDLADGSLVPPHTSFHISAKEFI